MNIAQCTQWVKKKAAEYGFDHCAIARAEVLDEEAKRLEHWLHQGMQGKMQYMENHFDLRIDPRKLVPGAQSVITFLKNYYPAQAQIADAPKISKYAYGKDYHEVIRAQLKALLADMQREIGAVEGRGFVDSAPVLERAWAEKSGLGWQGKNGMIIHKGAGSFFFIATLIVDIPLEYDAPMVKDYCGSCTKCIDACPTDAILPDKVVDGSKCISYFTIELKDLLLPDEQKAKFDNWLFGCDTCQDVCPWNRFSQPNTEIDFAPIPQLLNMSCNDWEEMTEASFKEIFRHSPLKRSKFAGIRRNLTFLKVG